MFRLRLPPSNLKFPVEFASLSVMGRGGLSPNRIPLPVSLPTYLVTQFRLGSQSGSVLQRQLIP